MKYIIILFILASATSCNFVKKKSKDAINGTGEVVAKAGSEFVSGVSKGIEKTFQNEVLISAPLSAKGLKTGKIIINSSDSGGTDNILSTYLIFDNDFDQAITVKVISEEGQEYGRVTQQVTGKKGEARYVDFLFDKRTNIDGKGKVSLE